MRYKKKDYAMPQVSSWRNHRWGGNGEGAGGLVKNKGISVQ